MCYFIYIFVLLCLFVFIGMFFVIISDRYRVIVYFMKLWLSGKKVKIILVIIWIIFFLICFFLIFVVGE